MAQMTQWSLLKMSRSEWNIYVFFEEIVDLHLETSKKQVLAMDWEKIRVASFDYYDLCINKS